LVKDNATATHLYRIAQEAINNAVKHGRATQVNIELLIKGKLRRLEVTDNGTGFRKAKAGHSGMGLRIMKYRADVIGGTLAVLPVEGGGTVVTCEFSEAL
jgi:signal transduction histidine kinase